MMSVGTQSLIFDRQVCILWLTIGLSRQALNTNLFPITYMLPSGKIFVAANRLAMLYDWKSNTEQRIQAPAIRPNYPSSATSVLLPMTIANNWTPDVLLCGGTTLDTDGDPSTLSATSSASTQCSRMTVSDAGVVQGWRTENMPTPRIMGCGILTPDGKVFITGGATNGVGGYGNVANEVRTYPWRLIFKSRDC